MKKGQIIDRTGQKYARLTFVRPTGNTNGRCMIWELLCDCGTIHYAKSSNVTSGEVKSCGCMLRESGKALGLIYGKLTKKYDPVISSARTVYQTYKDGCDFNTFFTLSQLPCYYCGSLPSTIYNTASTNHKDYTASDLQKRDGYFTYNGLDRIDSSFGHTIDNILPCCIKCNRMKMDRTLENFFEQIMQMNSHISQLHECPILHIPLDVEQFLTEARAYVRRILNIEMGKIK